MASFRASHAWRLLPLPAFLVLLAWIFAAQLPSVEAPLEKIVAGSQPYADAGSGRVKVLRPARTSVRIPSRRVTDESTGDNENQTSLLAFGDGSVPPGPLARATPAVFDREPVPVRSFTYDPRGPPPA